MVLVLAVDPPVKPEDDLVKTTDPTNPKMIRQTQKRSDKPKTI